MGRPTIPPIPHRVADPSQPGDPLIALAAYLNPPEPGAYIEVDLAPAVAIVAKVRAAGAVVAAARLVGHPNLHETDAAKRLADALDAFDQATDRRRSR
jgi:hypothetical protein